MDILEYKISNIEEFELPSGLKCRRRKVSPLKFIKIVEDKGGLLDDSFQSAMYEDLVLYSVMEPPLTRDETTETKLSIYDLNPDDTAEIITRIMGDIEKLDVEKFRSK